MTRAELQSMVSYWLDDLSNNYFTTTQINIWLNNAQKEVQKRLLQSGNNRYLKCVTTPTVVNQDNYVLPDDFLKLHRVEIITGGTAPNEQAYQLTAMTLNQRLMVYTGSASPMFYYLKKNRLVMQPPPDTAQTLRLWYSYLVADMSLDTDTPDVPTEYHELIALLAAEDGFIKDDRDNSKLKIKIAQYDEMLKQDAQERQVDQTRSIVETGWDENYGFYW